MRSPTSPRLSALSASGPLTPRREPDMPPNPFTIVIDPGAGDDRAQTIVDFASGPTASSMSST